LQQNVDRIKVENETGMVTEEDPRCVDSNDTDIPSTLSVQGTVPEVSLVFYFFTTTTTATTTTTTTTATTTTTTTTTILAAAVVMVFCVCLHTQVCKM